MKKYCYDFVVAFVISSIASWNSFADTRGLKISVKTRTGTAIPLYGNSYALVIGNGNYVNGWDPLPGAVRDVKEVSAALTKNGFSVTLKTDLTKGDFAFLLASSGAVEERSAPEPLKPLPKTLLSIESNVLGARVLIDGGGWRMPTRSELKTLYRKRKYRWGDLTPLLKIKELIVWSGDTKDSSYAWYFKFKYCKESWVHCQASYPRAFAVRSRR